MKKPDGRLLHFLEKTVEVRADELRTAFEVGQRHGWIATMRRLTGLTGVELGRQLGISQPAVTNAEANEAEDRITLAQLRRVADAFDCELVYGFVPRTSFAAIVAERSPARA